MANEDELIGDLSLEETPYVMKESSYVRTEVSQDFIDKVLKPYTEKARLSESKKNGTRKERVTKKRVCHDIIEEMQGAGLI